MRRLLLALTTVVTVAIVGVPQPATACCTIPTPPPCAVHPEMCA